MAFSLAVKRPLLGLHDNVPLPVQVAPQFKCQPKFKFPSVRIRCFSSPFNDKTLVSIKPNTSDLNHYDNALACHVHATQFGEQESNKSYKEAYAAGRNIRMSANKARRVIEQIHGRKYDETLMVLEFMPYRACEAILKIVFSAGANASNNLGLSKASLIISKAEVNEGKTMKRLRPVARGRAYQIKRRTCHITITVKGLPSDSVVEAKPA